MFEILMNLFSGNFFSKALENPWQYRMEILSVFLAIGNLIKSLNSK